MNAPDRVTVCVPVYNGARYLRETLDSVLSQECEGLKVIVQDNASTDATPSMLRDFSSDKRVAVFRGGTPVGMAANWNRCLSRAGTEFVMLLSADDVLRPGFMRAALNALEGGSGDAFSSNHFWLRDGKMKRKISPVASGVFRDFALLTLLWNPFSINFTLFRRQALLDISGPGGDIFTSDLLACDYDLWYRFAFSGKSLLYTSEPLGVYRVHTGSLSSNARKIRRHAVMVVMKHAAALRERWPFWFRLSLLRFLGRELLGRMRGLGRDRRLVSLLCAELAGRRS
jgi:glycosyltransferase involved in cell wall biosynthesis